MHELMALWFGSVHVVTTVSKGIILRPLHGLLTGDKTVCFAVHDLCLHSEYIELLRKELEGPQWEAFEKTGNGLPFLDSFLKESMRTTPVESSKNLYLSFFSMNLYGTLTGTNDFFFNGIQ